MRTRAAVSAMVAMVACHRDPPRRTETATGTGTGTGTATDTVTDTATVTGTDTDTDTATGTACCPLARAEWRFPAVPRLIAIGDVHGDLAAARGAMQLAGAVDANGAWIGGALWVVQTGDFLDRGGDEQAIIDWFERLEGEARAAGGRFVWLLGNHELMNAAGDLRYVTAAGMSDFDDVPGLALDRFTRAPAAVRARLAAFTPGGPYAQIMAGQNYVAIVGDTVFVHGGLRPGRAADLDADTLAARCWLVGAGPPPTALDDDEGAVWDRSFAIDPVACDTLDVALAELGVARMVVGHTVQDRGITSACDGKIWRIDVGLATIYGGPRQVLELTSAGARVLGRAP